MNIRIDADDVLNKLEKTSTNLTVSLSDALLRAGETVRADAYADCPVDTGKLRDSVKCSLNGSSVSVGTDVEYGAYVEMGTYKMPAKPFLVPALKNNEDRIIGIIKEAIKV